MQNTEILTSGKLIKFTRWCQYLYLDTDHLSSVYELINSDQSADFINTLLGKNDSLDPLILWKNLSLCVKLPTLVIYRKKNPWPRLTEYTKTNSTKIPKNHQKPAKIRTLEPRFQGKQRTYNQTFDVCKKNSIRSYYQNRFDEDIWQNSLRYRRKRRKSWISCLRSHDTLIKSRKLFYSKVFLREFDETYKKLYPLLLPSLSLFRL